MSWDRLAGPLRQHPRIARAAKAAFATAVAWAVVQPMGGIAADYPYYAPLGALIAVSSTVAESVRGSLQGLLAILLGSSLALGIGLLDVPEVAAVGVVVAGGTLLAGWWRVGGKADWVPLAALFVLIVGHEHPLGYAMAYLGLTALGAGVGIAVNLVFPPIPLTPTQWSVTRLRRELADQLEDLAQGLLQETPPDAAGWAQRRRAIRPLTAEMREMVAQATEARRGNWRIGRWQREADRQYQQARALEQLAFLVEQMTSFVVVTENAERDEVALGPSLRPYAAHAFQETAETLRSVDGEGVDVDLLREADAALSRLVDEVRDLRARQNSDLFGASTIVMTLRRTISSLSPSELEHQLPTA
jgi:uncharacterized membrane protein YgaE (UPF0421/DUF939 family)